MEIISLIEIVHILAVILAVGYIFTGFIKFNIKRDVLDAYVKRFDWHEFWFACLVASPGIIFHELAHKFVAMGFGLSAFFQASYFGLLIGILLKLFSIGFIVLAPGYVLISGASNVESMITAAAGPLVNLILWISAILFIKYKKHMTRKEAVFWALTNQINKWLFIFNMLPIPLFDGAKVWITLFQLIF